MTGIEVPAPSEREAFEAHYAKLFDLKTKRAFGGRQYVHPFVEAIWSGWRDRAALAQPDKIDS